MHKYKVEKSEEHNFIPEPVAFYSKINCPASLYNIHSKEKENSTCTVKVDERQPRIEE
jgi:hypothetical protein